MLELLGKSSAMRLLPALILVASLPAVACATGPVADGDRPNVVLILIDDQGYGDIAALAIRW